MEFEEEVKTFIKLATEKKLRMLMVGGGAVNFHGYRRHSADVDFWIDIEKDNLQKLLAVLNEMGYKIDELPAKVQEGNQNISINISPNQEIKLITRFNPGKSFEEAWAYAIPTSIKGNKLYTYKVLNFEDLVQSKIKSARPKDLLDIQELQRIRGEG